MTTAIGLAGTAPNPASVSVVRFAYARQLSNDLIEAPIAVVSFHVRLSEFALTEALLRDSKGTTNFDHPDSLNFWLTRSFDQLWESDDAYPPGVYRIELGGELKRGFDFHLDADRYPPMPRITNLNEISYLTDPLETTIRWDLGADSLESDLYQLRITNASGEIIHESPLAGQYLTAFDQKDGPRTTESLHEERLSLPPFTYMIGQLIVVRFSEFPAPDENGTIIATGRSAVLEFHFQSGSLKPVGPEITTQLSEVEVMAGEPFSLSFATNSDATQPLSISWYRDGEMITDRADPFTYEVPISRMEDAGLYHVIVSNTAGQVTSLPARVSIMPRPLPSITRHLTSMVLAPGEPGRLGVLVDETEGVSYVWYRNGRLAHWLNQPFFNISPSDTAGVADFRVEIWRDGRSLPSEEARVIVDDTLVKPPASEDRLRNLSLRARAGGKEGAVIVGFVLAGEHPASVLIRGAGPALAQFGVSDFLADPVLQLRSGNEMLTENDNYRDIRSTDLSNLELALGTFPLDSGDTDAALLIAIHPGTYTARISGHGAESGIAIAEIFEGDFTTHTILTNLSARANVGLGENVLIPGFVVGGCNPQTFLVRAIGPGLVPYGVQDTLTDPIITLRSANSTILARNEKWSDADNYKKIASVSQTIGAFALANDSQDAAILISLAPGAYTAVVSGAHGTVGTALVEVYAVPSE
ncbi:MAG: hypothetical protein R3F07_00500 [Opitutaceae bacterium]